MDSKTSTCVGLGPAETVLRFDRKRPLSHYPEGIICVQSASRFKNDIMIMT